ncbi:TetR/AcrR family transcriptional regulator [Phaeobacter sp. HF9A]|uniref:TetR/AcrR family transcriptional regulator n=1 Tax=Phaeobacter sp. HF9A TaxID=2721561 RepID=UPI0014317FEC|nr:TetR/AcrR family transcriptional regulator [Phaeobacter sp. HF9A]NIZ15046.1 TetR/AcrR family transcriptional regulator [Phaeobacter sp. HF9A]
MLRILDAAKELLSHQSFDDVRAEAIAERAEVSPGTLYNYFGGKNEILLTLAAIENEHLLDLGEAVVPDGATSAKALLNRLFDIYYGDTYMMWHRDIWRLGFALAFTDVSTEYSKRLRDSDRALRQQVVRATVQLQAQGKLRADLDCSVFGAMLFNNANMLFLEFTWSEHTTFDELRLQIRKMTEAMIDLAVPPGDAAG